MEEKVVSSTGRGLNLGGVVVQGLRLHYLIVRRWERKQKLPWSVWGNEKKAETST